MNSTKWYTLTDFVQHLSKTGQVRADQTDKGWFISVIQPDPEEKLAEEKRHKRDRAERVSACLSRELTVSILSPDSGFWNSATIHAHNLGSRRLSATTP